MKKIFFTLLFIGSITIKAQEKAPVDAPNAIHWMTWEEAAIQQKADLEKYNTATGKDKIPPKKMFIDMYTSWCGWCKRMDATTFKDPSIASVMNAYFYPIKMDAEQSAPINFNGHQFVNPNPGKSRSTHQFAASILDYKLSYPTYVLLDENVNRVAIYPGYKPVDDLLGILLFFGKNQHIIYRDILNKQNEVVKKAAQQKGQ